MGAIRVLVDTNVFVRETHLLRKKGGPELLRALKAVGGMLLVPEVLKTEYPEQSAETARDEKRACERSFSVLASLGASSDVLNLPEPQEFYQGAIARLEELAAMIEFVPEDDKLLADAGRRSISKKRPTDKTDHGYKDCVIWESVLRQPADSEVMLISRDDRAFFDTATKAIYRELREEAAARGIAVRCFRDVPSLLRELSQRIATELAESSNLVSTADDSSHDQPAQSRVSIPLLNRARSPAELPGAKPSAEFDPNKADEQLAFMLQDARTVFAAAEVRVLGYVAHLGDPPKSELFETLEGSGTPRTIAKNAAERLVDAGFLTDTGNHYLVKNTAAGQLARKIVEPDVIRQLGLGTAPNG